MPDTWDDLEALCAELHALDSGWAERHARLTAELESLKPLLELLDRHEQALAPAAALARVRTRLLGGAGVVQHTVLDFGLQRMAVLAWPSTADPRPELSATPGECRVEVWLYADDHGRARARVVGARRLEAMLPAPPEKFHAALLGAVRAPAFTPAPVAVEPEAAGTPEPTEPAPPTPTAEPPGAPPDEQDA